MLFTSAVSWIWASDRSSLDEVMVASISLMVMWVTPKLSWEWALSQVQVCAKLAEAARRAVMVMKTIFFMLLCFFGYCCLNIDLGAGKCFPRKFIALSRVHASDDELFSDW